MYGGFGRDFTAADGERFMLVALTSRHWSELLQMTGLAETVNVLAKALGVDFDDEGDRYRHRQVLASLVAEWFARYDGEAVRTALSNTRLLASVLFWLQAHPLCLMDNEAPLALLRWSVKTLMPY